MYCINISKATTHATSDNNPAHSHVFGEIEITSSNGAVTTTVIADV